MGVRSPVHDDGDGRHGELNRRHYDEAAIGDVIAAVEASD